MVGSVITILGMGGLFLWIWNKGCLASTRRMALLPLAVCAIEVFTFGLIQTVFPFVAALLWLSRLLLAFCCIRKLCLDRRTARRRAERRAAVCSAVPCERAAEYRCA